MAADRAHEKDLMPYPVLDAIEKARTRVLAQRNTAEKKKVPPTPAAPAGNVPPKG